MFPRHYMFATMLLMPALAQATPTITQIYTTPGDPRYDPNIIYQAAVSNDGSYAILINDPYSLIINGETMLPPSEALGNPIISIARSNTNHTISLVSVPQLKSTSGFPTNSSFANQIYFDQSLLLQSGLASASSALPPGSTWDRFYDACLTDNNELYVIGTVASPGIGVKGVMGRFSIDETGQLTQQQILFVNGTSIGNSAAPASLIRPQHWQWQVNNAGQVLTKYNLQTPGDPLPALYLDSTPLVRGGDPSPITGHTYGDINAAHLNNHGDWAAVLSLDDDLERSMVVLSNGSPLAKVGDLLPNGKTLSGILEQVFVADDGAVFWAGISTSETGYDPLYIFRNHDMIIEQDVSNIDGIPFNYFFTVSFNAEFSVSQDGTHITFNGTLANGISGLFLLTIPEPTSLATLLPFLLLRLRRRAGGL